MIDSVSTESMGVQAIELKKAALHYKEAKYTYEQFLNCNEVCDLKISDTAAFRKSYWDKTIPQLRDEINVAVSILLGGVK